jgi:hypothetical protein
MIILYYGIGLASSPHAAVLWKADLRHVVVLCTLIFAVPTAIADAVSWRRFALAVQVAALVALAVCVAEASSPRVAVFLSLGKDRSLEDIAYHAFRPSGLLRNSNEMGNFFVFTFLLSYWCPGIFRTAGRVASVFGTYLSASRGGAVLLALCIFLYAGGAMRYRVAHAIRGSWRLIGVGLVTCLLVFAAYRVIGHDVLTFKSDTGISRTERIFSLTDKTGVSGRLELWKYWLPKAVNAPVYGEGYYSFQGGVYSPASRRVSNQGTHNTWIMLLGEVGPLGPLFYFFLLILALVRVLRIRGFPMDRLVVLLLWGVYLSFTLKAHTILEYRYYTIAMALLLYLPWFINQGFGGNAKGEILNSATC